MLHHRENVIGRKFYVNWFMCHGLYFLDIGIRRCNIATSSGRRKFSGYIYDMHYFLWMNDLR